MCVGVERVLSRGVCHSRLKYPSNTGPACTCLLSSVSPISEGTSETFETPGLQLLSPSVDPHDVWMVGRLANTDSR